MTDQPDDARASIVAAVQRELTRFGQQVTTEVQRLRDELATERAARARTEATLSSLAPVLEKAQAANQSFQVDLQRLLDDRLGEFATQTKRRHDDMDLRIGRIADETNIGLAAAVESAVRPVVKQLEHRQTQVETDLTGLDRSVRKFDDQAGKIVQHLNAMSVATEARLDEVAAQVTSELDGRLTLVSSRVDEISAQAARHQAEVANVVGSRVDQAEDRINERIVTAEARITDSMGQRIADIDAYVGRVSAGLDDSVAVLSERIAAADARFDEINGAFEAMHAKLDSLDVDAIDEMKDRVGGLAGEVELVRIEVERFQKSMGEQMDKSIGRIVELETQMQEQHMDVDTAVQLERLEEVERALIALDPGQFVRREDTTPISDSDAAEMNIEFAMATPQAPDAAPAAAAATVPPATTTGLSAPSRPVNPLVPPMPFEPHATAQH